jgi:hypothetical protein
MQYGEYALAFYLLPERLRSPTHTVRRAATRHTTKTLRKLVFQGYLIFCHFCVWHGLNCHVCV